MKYSIFPINICKFLFSILIIFLFSFCYSKTEESKSTEELDSKIKTIQENYRKKIQGNYILENSSSSKEESVHKFLQGISEGKADTFACSKEDYLEIFLPSSVDEKTLTSRMEPEKAWEITVLRREPALAELTQVLRNKKFEILEIQWKRLNRKLNSLNSHQIGSIIFQIENKKYTTENIKLVIENNKQFKVCVYAK